MEIVNSRYYFSDTNTYVGSINKVSSFTHDFHILILRGSSYYDDGSKLSCIEFFVLSECPSSQQNFCFLVITSPFWNASNY